LLSIFISHLLVHNKLPHTEAYDEKQFLLKGFCASVKSLRRSSQDSAVAGPGDEGEEDFKFKASLSYTVQPCLRKEKKTQTGSVGTESSASNPAWLLAGSRFA
jgi:hypothetical protein